MARTFVLGLDGVEAMSTSDGAVIDTKTDPGIQSVIERDTADAIANPNFEAPEQVAQLNAGLNNVPGADI